jgi:hypothetical protein
MVKYTLTQLMKILNQSKRATLHRAKTLRFLSLGSHNTHPQNKNKKEITFYFKPAHPFIVSLKLCQEAPSDIIQPIYTIRELTDLWTWHKQNYSIFSIHKKLHAMDVPLYNNGAGSKSFVYLSDLVQALQKLQEND